MHLQKYNQIECLILLSICAMFNLRLYPTLGKVVFVSMFAIDQQVNMSACPFAFGSPSMGDF